MTEAVVGIIVGSFFAVLFLVIVLRYFFKRKKHSAAQAQIFYGSQDVIADDKAEFLGQVES